MRKDNNLIPAVNFHLTKRCNMKCKYCFAGFNKVKNNLTTNQQKDIINKLYNAGFNKINFVGGEPFLVKRFSELIKYAKQIGFYTSVVTNGSLITVKFIKENAPFIDLIGLSIDSLNSKTNKKIGRVYQNTVPDKSYYEKICTNILNSGIDLKINTVVSQFNFREIFSDFILKIDPIRWKIFQVLSIEEENDIESMKVSDEEFNFFITQNHKAKEFMISEKSNIIKGSYIMIDPEGKFFDNTNGKYNVSESISKIGVEQALKQINFSKEKFIKRNGNYYEKLMIKKSA
jgi:radical S-adenosyl methionine domain-containing protein 2